MSVQIKTEDQGWVKVAGKVKVNSSSSSSSGGNSNTYSSTETVIGTYMGKPLYRITYECPKGTGGCSDYTSLVPTIPNLDYTNIDKPINLWYELVENPVNSYGYIKMVCPIQFINNKIYTYRTTDYFTTQSFRTFTWTVEYTKKTD